MKNSKMLKVCSFLLTYLLISSIIPVNSLVKAATNSPKTVSGYESLYEIDAEQIENTTAIVTTTTNKDHSGNLRVVAKNGNVYRNIDLNMESVNAISMGKYNNKLYYLDTTTNMVYSVDVKNAAVSSGTKLPAVISTLDTTEAYASIDKDGVIWIYRAYDSRGKECIVKIANNDCAVLQPTIAVWGPIKSSSFFMGYDRTSSKEKLAKIDSNNNINYYSLPDGYYNVAIDNANGIWLFDSTSIEKCVPDANNQLVPTQKYTVDSDKYYSFQPVFDKNNMLWINVNHSGKILGLVNNNLVEKFNYSTVELGSYSDLSIYDEYNFVLGNYTKGYLRYSVNSADMLYKNAYDAVMAAISANNQKGINEARVAIEALRGTDAEWAIGEFSKNVDKIQHPILVKICNAITVAEANPVQANINAARATIDPELPDVWRSSYSSGLDIIQQGLMKKVIAAVDKAVATKAKADIDAANLLIEDVKTATDPAIAAWAVEMQKQLPN